MYHFVAVRVGVVRVLDERAVFPAEADSVGDAREVVTTWLTAAGCRSDVVEAARLLVSELATNAADGNDAVFSVLVRREGVRVVVEVTGQDRDTIGDVAATRHFELVDRVADGWSVRDDADASCAVAFELTC